MIVALLLLASGCATLVHQVCWQRLLGLSFGSTHVATSLVLAAFFLGMAGGNALAARLQRPARAGLLLYAGLELVIGLSALGLLPVFVDLPRTFAAAPAWAAQPVPRFGLALALMLLPTLAMGATFPVLLGAVLIRRGGWTRRLGWLYGLNTLGAVVGAVLGAFVLVPAWGLDGAVRAAAALNGLAALVAVGAAARAVVSSRAPDEREPAVVGPSSAEALVGQRRLASLVLLVSGFTSIGTEVAWTRALALFMGGTVYGFGAILAVFLGGLALGGLLLRGWAARVRDPATALLSGLALVGVAMLLTRVGLGRLPDVHEWLDARGLPAGRGLALRLLVVFVVLGPPTVLLGGLFPLALAVFSGARDGVGAQVGRAYALNTTASIAGSLAVGLWALPRFGTDAVLVALALLCVAPAAARACVGAAARARLGLLAAVAVGLALAPGVDWRRYVAAVDYRFDDDATAEREPRFLFLQEAATGIVSVVTYDDEVARLQNNGLNESEFELSDPDRGLVVESLLAYVPALLHPDPRDAFVIGFGGGVTTTAFTRTDVESIRVVELEPVVVDAIRATKGDGAAPFVDPRVRIDIDDARRTLLLEPARYDVIVSQPSHPWRAGAGPLFTLEFFELVRSRLRADGLFGQWVNLFRMDSTTLRAILAAFFEVFEHGCVLANVESGDMLLFGSPRALRLDAPWVSPRAASEPLREGLARCRVAQPGDLLWYSCFSRAEALAAVDGAAPNRDTRLLTETRLGALATDPAGDEDPYGLIRAHHGVDVSSLYAAEDIPEGLARAGELFVRRGHLSGAELALARLEDLDPSRASRLRELLEQARAAADG